MFTMKLRSILMVVVYLLPLLVMGVTYSLVGRRLWGGAIPGDSAALHSDQLQAKRKVHTHTHTHTHTQRKVHTHTHTL